MSAEVKFAKKPAAVSESVLKPEATPDERTVAAQVAVSPPIVPPNVPPIAVAAPPEKPFKPIVQGRLFVAHSSEGRCGNIWSATVEKDTPFAHALRDEFWANRARDMHVGDRIWVAVDDEKWDAELRVTGQRVVGAGVVPNRVSVAVLRFTEITPPESYADIGDHEIKFMGQHLKWCVVRRADQSIANEGFEDQASAEKQRRNLSLAKTK